jgi:hypothetical protein
MYLNTPDLAAPLKVTDTCHTSTVCTAATLYYSPEGSPHVHRISHSMRLARKSAGVRLDSVQVLY